MDLNDKVSNLDDNVFVLKNLEPEMIAVLFAYISRSKKGVRENLKEINLDNSKKFHEKWVIEYGHDSVAELANIHVVLEKVSRFFTSVFERISPFVSFIEMSQRYQLISTGSFYVPSANVLKKTEIEKVVKYNEFIYGKYIAIVEKLKSYKNSEGKKKYSNTEIYESARYLLPLSTYTSLSFSVNARSLKEILKKMNFYSNFDEFMDICKKIKKEALFSLPTLLNYSEDINEYRNMRGVPNWILNMKSVSKVTESDSEFVSMSFNSANGFNIGEESIIYYFANEIMRERVGVDINCFNYDNERRSDFQSLVGNFISDCCKNKINLPSYFDSLTFEYSFRISECCFHQLLRHRSIRIDTNTIPIGLGGFKTPTVISENKECLILFNEGVSFFNDFIAKNEFIYNEEILPYLVLNAHERNVRLFISLRAFINLYFLRYRDEAQEEIRNMTKFIYDDLKNRIPNIIKYIKK